MASKNAGAGCGEIKNASDPHGYLGHFRSADVIKKGHNLGPPRGPVGLPALAGTPSLEGGGGMRPPAAPKIADAGGAFNPGPKLEGGGGFRTPPMPTMKPATKLTKTQKAPKIKMAKPNLYTGGGFKDQNPKMELASAVKDVMGAHAGVRNAVKATKSKKMQLGGGFKTPKGY